MLKKKKKSMLKRAIDESHEMHQKREDFAQNVLKKCPTMPTDELETLSFVWKNVTFFGMHYSSTVMKKLNVR